ncbi:MFS transporter [Heyndrickxia oleronia]|uniref:MFS transporter n=1 Tax=Heyndrickxia oleronia TaxID=38875 RepID=A0A8E2LDA5_9BACI|nr:MFS transporter [Heyndrickxia oleronia]MEC1373511.1 MFS transporter [Heyndrickxia oleronia]OJH16173.1 MFS transporter [Bacillus obstructivus]OOP66412.1 MFS transporter [Heyndrickxia oleronia]
MNQETPKGFMGIPQYIIISFLTIFAIGPQYFINLSYSMNQEIVQNSLHFDSEGLMIPSILANIAFALGIPFGPVLTRVLGFKRNYLIMLCIFLLGSFIGVISPDLLLLIIGRIIQGISAGILFLTILPVSLRSFPNKVRNTFLFMVITGLFGATAMGALFGSLSLSVNTWRWLFILNILSALLCLIVGYFGLPRNEVHVQQKAMDKTGGFLYCLMMIILAIPLCNLMEKGFASLYVWPFFVLAFILAVLFIFIDLKAENPLIPFRTLKAAKPISGTVMAVASHVLLVLSIAGINGFVRHNMDLPFHYLLHFYFWFFIGIVVTAILHTLLYSALGAGKLGIVGSLIVIYVSFQWRTMSPEISLSTLYFQIACLGAGVSMVLVGGALGTAFAGDLHFAPMRSATLHSIRNFVGAIITPIVGWFISTQNAIQYENIRGNLGQFGAEAKSEMAQTIHRLVETGMSASEAKTLASYELIANSKKAAILGAYHHLFTIMLGVAVIMLIGSIGKMATGKGIGLVKKEKKSPVSNVKVSPNHIK